MNVFLVLWLISEVGFELPPWPPQHLEKWLKKPGQQAGSVGQMICAVPRIKQGWQKMTCLALKSSPESMNNRAQS